jgi:hypothetical protein
VNIPYSRQAWEASHRLELLQAAEEAAAADHQPLEVEVVVAEEEDQAC